LLWDTYQRGLALLVQPSGYRSFKLIYRHHNRPRWLTIGAADAIGLAEARRLAAELMLEVIRGRDPQAERRAERGAGTFAELARRYVEEHAKKTFRKNLELRRTKLRWPNDLEWECVLLTGKVLWRTYRNGVGK
jgi:hypothetical protein